MIYKNYEKSIPSELYPFLERSEMSESERDFLYGTVNDIKPKKIVEIGVAAGASSLIIAQALEDSENADAQFYSLDYSTEYYRDKSQNTGFLMNSCENLKKRNILKTGGMSCNFLDEIGADIDFCLLDTVHSNPGELLDYLQILPYLKKNASIVLHDISLNTVSGNKEQYTCGMLFSVLNGEKILPSKTEHKFCPNIGAVRLADDAYENAFDVFNALLLPWSYDIGKENYENLEKHFLKHYDKELVSLFKNAYQYNQQQLHETRHQSFYKKSKTLSRMKKTLKHLFQIK